MFFPNFFWNQNPHDLFPILNLSMDTAWEMLIKNNPILLTGKEHSQLGEASLILKGIF